MTSSFLLGKIFNDKESRGASLRQLSFF